MAYFETGSFCSPAEYEAGQAERIDPSVLHIEEYYMLMLAFRTDIFGRSRAKQPVQTTKLQQIPNGLYKVEFNCVDADLQPFLKTEEIFENGYLLTGSTGILSSYGDPLMTGYLKSYHDDIDDTLLLMSQGITSHNRQLVAS